MSNKLQLILKIVNKYQLPNWIFQQSQILNPYRLASIGYYPSEPGIIQCQICNKKVEIKQQFKEEQLLNQLKSHQKQCFYLNQNQYYIQQKDIYLAIDQIIGYLSQGSNQNLPYLNTQAIINFTKDHSFLVKRVFQLHKIQINNENTQNLLKMFGWFISKNESQVQVISCYFCGRSIQLSNYQIYNKTNFIIKNIQKQKLFNPIQQHRYFCCWVGHDNFWLIYLQDMQDRYNQYISFRLNLQRDRCKQRIRGLINRQLQRFKQKIENNIDKIKIASKQLLKLSQQLSNQTIFNIEQSTFEEDIKKIKLVQKNMLEMQNQFDVNQNYSLKKIKLS